MTNGGASGLYRRDFSPDMLIALLNNFVLVWGCLGPLWLRYAVRSAKYGVYAHRSHCRWICNWVGAPCQTENITTERLAHQDFVYDSTALQCSVDSFTVLDDQLTCLTPDRDCATKDQRLHGWSEPADDRYRLYCCKLGELYTTPTLVYDQQ